MFGLNWLLDSKLTTQDVCQGKFCEFMLLDVVKKSKSASGASDDNSDA